MFQFTASPFCMLWIYIQILKVLLSRFPHSDISGSMAMCASPKLFAAYHVLHRLPVPRHSPHALTCLTFMIVAFLLFFRSFYFKSISFLDFWLLLLLVFSFQGAFTDFFSLSMEIARFELATPCLQGRCSPNWAKPPFTTIYFYIKKWAQVDSNHRPRAYQARALTGWAMSP